jgi:hypothetical protein
MRASSTISILNEFRGHVTGGGLPHQCIVSNIEVVPYRHLLLD